MDSTDGADLVCLDKGAGEVVPIILKQHLKRLAVGAEEGDQLKCGCCSFTGVQVQTGWAVPKAQFNVWDCQGVLTEMGPGTEEKSSRISG